MSLLAGITELGAPKEASPMGTVGGRAGHRAQDLVANPPLLMDARLLVLLNPDGWAQINQCRLSKRPADPYIIRPPLTQAARTCKHRVIQVSA